MKTIKIWYVDFDSKFNKDEFFLTKLLKENYNLLFDKEKPDFVICSRFGNDYINFEGPRILIVDDKLSPDFNLYDYAISPQDIIFGDRHFKCASPMDQNYETLKHEEALTKFINHIFDQENKKAIRRSGLYTMWGRVYEQRQKKWFNVETRKWFGLIRAFYACIINT